MTNKNTKETLDNITESLERLVEQTQVKASLLKLESKDVWEDLTKGLHKIQNLVKSDWIQTKQDTDEALLKTHLGMMEVKEEWDEFKVYLDDAVEKVKIGEKYDHARLQAHLGKMELNDRFKDKKDEWQSAYETKVKPHFKNSMEHLQKEIVSIAKSLTD